MQKIIKKLQKQEILNKKLGTVRQIISDYKSDFWRLMEK